MNGDVKYYLSSYTQKAYSSSSSFKNEMNKKISLKKKKKENIFDR